MNKFKVGDKVKVNPIHKKGIIVEIDNKNPPYRVSDGYGLTYRAHESDLALIKEGKHGRNNK